MNFSSKILTKLLAPMLLLFAVGVTLVVLLLSSASEEAMIEASRQNAVGVINQFKTLRAYYTANVVAKVKKYTQLALVPDHQDKEAIPLPATMIHDLSGLLEKQPGGIKLRLFSDYPFPNRLERKLDPFEQEAMDYLRKNPSQVLTRKQDLGGSPVLRVAIADFMAVEACVKCHNSHPQTPKNDWKLGEVRGVLEVIAPIGDQISANQRMIAKVSGVLVVVFALVFFVQLGFIHGLILKPLRQVVGKLKIISQGEGDLRGRIEIDRRDEIGELALWFNSFLSKLRDLVSRIQDTATTLATASQELAQGSRETSLASDEITQSLEQENQAIFQVQKLVEEMVMDFSHNSQGVEQAMVASRSTSQEMNKGSQSLGLTTQTMDKIAESSKKIEGIIGVITTIANQTNLLSLNAAIEAAKAGEFGKGFAVVADEVRGLAVRSSRAVDEIRILIEESVKHVGKGNQVISETGQSLTALIDHMQEISRIIQQLSDSLQGQSQRTSSIQKETEAIAHISESNATAANQFNSSLKEMVIAINEIGRISEDLNHQVSRFRC